MSFNRISFCKCSECMLQGKNIVSSEGPPNPKIAIIGEAPGKNEDLQGKPFIGESGYLLNDSLARIGLSRQEVYIMNTIQCRPNHNNDMKTVEAQNAINCCYVGFKEELKYLKELGVTLLIPVGNTALHAIGIDNIISKARGNIYIKDGFTIIPTYHPAYIIHQKYSGKESRLTKIKLVWYNDLNKARIYSKKKYVPPKENFNIFPSIEDIENFTNYVIEKKLLVSVDIETTQLDPQEGEIVVTGMAYDTENAISFPKLKEGGLEYWGNDDKKRAKDCMQRIFAECPLMFQNALYDCYWLLYKGFYINNIKHDTMLLHACGNPEMQHNLEFLNSMYGYTPSWKGEFSSHKIPILSKPDKITRPYNCRDVVVPHQILPGLLEDAKDVLDIYYNTAMKLIPPVLEMQLNGIIVDKKELSSFKNELDSHLQSLEENIRRLCNLPEEFNINAVQQQIYLLFNKKPGWYTKAVQEIDSYNENNSRKNKNTKKYRELVKKVNLINNIEPFIFPKGLHAKKTDGGAYSTKDESLTIYKIAALKRLNVISNLKRTTKSHIKEEILLKRSVSYIELLKEYRGVEKLRTSYTEFKIGIDGKIHPRFKIHGTATGRLSTGEEDENKKVFISKDKILNIQTVPSKAKKIFISEMGKVLLNIDFSNIELRVLAIISDDEVLQEMFDNNLNIHDINTELLFGVTKSDPLWKTLRRVEKMHIFGRNYGSTLLSIYKKIMNEVNNLKMSYEEFKKIDAKHFSLHPKYAVWRKDTENELLEKRELTTVFGRKRIFYGSDNEILREGLNFPIQSPAADIANIGIIRVYNERKVRNDFDLLFPVHDSIVVQTEVKLVNKTSSFIKNILEREFIINNKPCSFPVDCEVGYSYGYMVPLEVWNIMGDKATRKHLEIYCKLMDTEAFRKLSIEDRIKSL